MSKPVRIASAVSIAALACAIAACAAPQGRLAATGFGGQADGEVGLATKALAALVAKDVPAAIGYAERAVVKTPDDAGFRALLGNAYFAGGRFASAESAFKDSLSIYSNQPQVVLKLALVEIAQGKTAEAAAFLEAARSVLDPADYGLALALAGHASEAVEALRDAARAQGVDARVRQNLALSYALAGDWTNARVVAAQDLAGDQVDARIQQWMKLATPGRPSDQVAALTGVVPALADPGQPVRLALHKAQTGTAVAAAAPQPQTVATVTLPPARAFVAARAPAPQAAEVVAAAQSFARARPAAPAVVEAVAPAAPPSDPARVGAPVELAQASVPAPFEPEFVEVRPRSARPAFTRAAAPLPRLRRAAAPVAHAQGRSSAVVQLGAYGSAQSVLAAWNAAARRYSALRAYAPVSARFNSGRGMVYRLSVRGFASNGEAGALCTNLRRAGGACFVRNVAGDAPVQIASR